MRAVGLLAIFLLLCSLSLATEPCAYPTDDYADTLCKITLPTLGVEFLLIVGLSCVGLIALFYMMAGALQSAQLTAWSKDELRELIAGIVIVALVWTLTTGLDVSAQQLTDANSFSELGGYALDSHLEYMESLYLKLADAYHSVGMLQGIGYFASAGVMWFYAGQGASPLFGLSTLLGPISNAASNITTQILIFRLIRIFTFYVAGSFPTFVLPVALAFRMFPFTRKMGNTMIAICLGAMIIFPMSLLAVHEFEMATQFDYKVAVTNQEFTVDALGLGGYVDDVFTLTSDICGNIAMRVVLTLGEFFWAALYATITAMMCAPPAYAACWATNFNTFWGTIWPAILTVLQILLAVAMTIVFTFVQINANLGGLDPIVKTLLPAVVEATGFSILSFLMMVLITFTGIKAISSALGGDYVLYGVSRFV